MDFINYFKKFVYRNTYIYNLIDNYSMYVYPYYSIVNADINNVILLFNHYLQANFKSYTIYIDADLYFTSTKLCM